MVLLEFHRRWMCRIKFYALASKHHREQSANKVTDTYYIGQEPVAIAIIVTAKDHGISAKAALLAKHLELPVVEANTTGLDFVLEFSQQRLQLRNLRTPREKPVYIDLLKTIHSFNTANLTRKQPLVWAMGKGVKTIVDATAGFGHDATLLACLGYRVTAIERAGIIHALLKDALVRASGDYQVYRKIKYRLFIEQADARDYLKALTELPDVVYLDPMYPPKRKKSALTRKSLRLLREIVGEDRDAADLLETARAYAAKRVVVKRPHYAQPLLTNPDMSISGNLVRYDIYLTRKLNKI